MRRAEFATAIVVDTAGRDAFLFSEFFGRGSAEDRWKNEGREQEENSRRIFGGGGGVAQKYTWPAAAVCQR